MTFAIQPDPDVVLAPARRGLRARVRCETFAYWSSPQARRWHVQEASPAHPSLAELRSDLHAGARPDALRRAAATEAALLGVHRAPVPVIGPPATSADAVDEGALSAEVASLALLAPGRSRVLGRWRAGRAASRALAEEAEVRRTAAASRHEQDLDEASAHYDALLANDPDAVISALEATFDHDEVPAAPIGCEGDVVAVVLRLPAASEVPDERVDLGARRPAVVGRSEADRHAFYLRLLASSALATVRRVVAAAPGTRHVRLLAVRPGPSPRGVEALFAGTFAAEDGATALDLDGDGLLDLLLAGEDRLLAPSGVGGELTRLDLEGEPAIAAVVAAVDGALHP